MPLAENLSAIDKMAGKKPRRYIASVKTPAGSITRATFLIITSAICFGSISVLTVLLTKAGVSLVNAMAWRYILGGLILAAVGKLEQLKKFPRRRIIQLLLIGGSGQALITYVSLHALNYIGVGPLAFLFYTYPAWVAIVAAVRRTEKLTRMRIVALLIALLGVTVMVGGGMSQTLNPTGVALAVGSALLYSGYLPALEHLQRNVPALPATFLLIAGAAITFALVSITTNQFRLVADTESWVAIGILAIASTVIAFSALIKGLSVLGPVRTAIIATVEPFFTAILGIVVLGNQLTLTTLAGGVLIAAAILMIEWSSTRTDYVPVNAGAAVSRFRLRDSAGRSD